MTRAERRIIAARIRRRLHRIFVENENTPPSKHLRIYRDLRCNEGRKWPGGYWYRDRQYQVEGRQAKHLREMARLNEEYRLWQHGEFDEPAL